jgi:hypothetical protein
LQPIEDAPGSYVRARVHTAAGNQGNTIAPHQDFLRDRL